MGSPNMGGGKSKAKWIVLSILGLLVLAGGLFYLFVGGPNYAVSQMTEATSDDGGRIDAYVEAYNTYDKDSSATDDADKQLTIIEQYKKSADEFVQGNNQSLDKLNNTSTTLPLIGFNSTYKDVQSLKADYVSYYQNANQLVEAIGHLVDEDANIVKTSKAFENLSTPDQVESSLRDLSMGLGKYSDQLASDADVLGKSGTEKVKASIDSMNDQLNKAMLALDANDEAAFTAAMDQFGSKADTLDDDFGFIGDGVNKVIADPYNELVDRYNSL